MQSYRFAEFSLHGAERRLDRDGREVSGLRERDFDVLALLVENRPRILSKDEIIRFVWNGTAVEDNSVERAIANIRKALGDSAAKPAFIKTVRGRGYLFVAAVEKIAGETATGRAAENRRGFSSPKKARSASVFLLAAIAFVCFASLPFIRGKTGNPFRRAVFADDFAGAKIDPEKWRAAGSSIRAADGVVRISVDEVDRGGELRSVFFSVDPEKTLTVRSRLKVAYNQSLQSNVNFVASFGLVAAGQPAGEPNAAFFGVKFANADGEFCYPGNVLRAEGFYLVRGNGDVRLNRHHNEGRIGPRVEPLWDQWFEQTLVYEPRRETLLYFVNGEKKGEFVTGGLPFGAENRLQMVVYPQGWWLHHFIEIDEIEVTQ